MKGDDLRKQHSKIARVIVKMLEPYYSGHSAYFVEQPKGILLCMDGLGTKGDISVQIHLHKIEPSLPAYIRHILAIK